MSKIVSIHQPQYLPWLGYFDKINKADVFVLLDDVQYKKNEWQNRNKIRTPKGGEWITVPIRYKFGEKIDLIKIDNSRNWRKGHYKSLVTNYNKALYFKEYEPFFKITYESNWEYLVDINIHFIEYLVGALGITTKLIRSSKLAIERQKTERLVEICKKLGADTYLSGMGAKAYLDKDKFKRARIKLIYQNFKCPVYKQSFNISFISNLSVIDLIFNCGRKSKDILFKE